LEGLSKGGWVRDSVCEAAKQALKILKNIDTTAVKFVTTKGSSFKSTTFFEEENNFVCFVHRHSMDCAFLSYYHVAFSANITVQMHPTNLMYYHFFH